MNFFKMENSQSETKNKYLEEAQKHYEEGKKLLDVAKQDITYKFSPRFCTALIQAKEKFEESLRRLEFCDVEDKENILEEIINAYREKVSACLSEIKEKIEPQETKVFKLDTQKIKSQKKKTTKKAA